jgi:hypothetical protein
LEAVDEKGKSMRRVTRKGQDQGTIWAKQYIQEGQKKEVITGKGIFNKSDREFI